MTAAYYRTLGLIFLLQGLGSRWSVVQSIQVVRHHRCSRSTANTAHRRCAAIPVRQSSSTFVGPAVGRVDTIRRRTARNPTATLFQSASPIEPTTTPGNDKPPSPDETENAPSLDRRLGLLQRENQFLRDTIREMESSNQAAEGQRRIVIEKFEGEGRRSPTDEPWWNGDDAGAAVADLGEMALEECEDPDDDGTCPLEPDVSFKDALRDRAYWLVGLLALQSMSGFILARNELLLQSHPVIIYFLTMLVGAGGNAGNQASVRVIRGLALGNLNAATQRRFLTREFKMACALSVVLSAAGFIRAVVFRTPIAETIAITTALTLIVFSSICLGAVLPLVLRNLKVDPAHSSTTIQVIMDILGVVLTVAVSGAILDSGLGRQLVSKLVGGG